MIRFNGILNNINFDADGYRKKLDETLQTQLRQAARAWLRAVIPLVPVWTGMARGSLVPLGRFLRVAVPIEPEVFRRDQTPELGAAKSSFSFTNTDGVYEFEWNTDVLHYILNEFNDMSHVLPLRHATPWHSTEAGKNAFRRYVQEVMPSKVPHMREFIELTTRRGM